MNTILFLWAVAAANNYGRYMAWQNAGTFNSPAACIRAAATLRIKDTDYRCIPTH